MRKTVAIILTAAAGACGAEEFPKPYSAPCVERENVFEFTEKPKVKNLGNDKYEITFAVKGNCDVTAGIVDSGVDATPSSRGVGGFGSGGGAASTGGAEAAHGVVVRHLGAGVLGANAPAPFQKNSLRQTIYWNGKDDLDVYHKEPGKLKVRVMLGLKPECDKRLGGTSPYNIPGKVWGLAADPDGVYVISYFVRFYIRRFNHDGKYDRSLLPPPRNLSESKLGGRGFIEYEPGKREIHAPRSYSTTAQSGDYLPYAGAMHDHMQPAMSNGRIVYCNSGINSPSLLHWLGTDGSSDPTGMSGRPFAPAGRRHGGWNGGFMFLASSPDGKWIYMTDGFTGEAASSCVWRCPIDGKETAEVFAGKCSGKGGQGRFAPGSAPGEFNNPLGIDCDAQGRLYVCDERNNRLQIFSPEARYLKEIPIDRPQIVQVHKKTGAIYLYHTARVQGVSVERISKLASCEDPKVIGYLDYRAACMALDSWSPEPMIWLGGGAKTDRQMDVNVNEVPSVTVWRDKGTAFEKVVDFEEEARKEAGENYFGRWNGGGVKEEKLAADAVREQVYYGGGSQYVFDLRTGRPLRVCHLGGTDDLAFDKKGYLHQHFNPGFYFPGVGRVDPNQSSPTGRRLAHLPNIPTMVFKEVPYDYGLEGKLEWKGVLPVRDQPGSKFFQDGIGVNMMGDVAENCNIYYAPKMEEETAALLASAPVAFDGDRAAVFMKDLQEKLKRGEEVYWIRRQPGVSLIGATIWTFDRNGEVRQECAAITGGHINGVQIDEDGKLYFVHDQTKLVGKKGFLAGQGGTFGVPDDKRNRSIGFGEGPFTGTLFKTAGKGVRVLAPKGGFGVPMDELPNRPADLSDGSWVEGAEWMYAGASAIVQGGCTCPMMRFHTDWYKRTFVPEAYRHSVGILDTNGNLIMHLGRYGNFDDAPMAAGKGGEDIAVSFVSQVAGTDNYLCLWDHGERLVVMKLNYHAEETVGIGGQ